MDSDAEYDHPREETTLEDDEEILVSSPRAFRHEQGDDSDNPIPVLSERQRIQTGLVQIDEEIKKLDEEMRSIKELRALRVSDRAELEAKLKILNGLQRRPIASLAAGLPAGAVDYTAAGFEWSFALRSKMSKIFGIKNFRLCQEGVCNANMEGRDIVVVMPTGGGKSLTYQLPALLTPGCTLVISPLISLITDQLLHLREAGVQAVMLTGGTSKDEARSINARIAALANRKGTGQDADDIKLCYVTPEKIAKSKGFRSQLEKLSAANQLARIVVDEAHCVSSLGHDFRPDYSKLTILRQLFPRVPIMALSATCRLLKLGFEGKAGLKKNDTGPPDVLKDILKILRMKSTEHQTQTTTPGNAASAGGTVYFSAPLYRKNLHYKVLPKPSSAKAVLEAMTEYILKHHKDETGIVYCTSKSDAATVAESLRTISGGQIKTGVYHAAVGEHEKEALHKQWRKGDVKVVCATIAFGLGIDKGDVRFVLHHSLSKSMDGFYQESGRAGRDGTDADCVLFYRPQDTVRAAQIVCSELTGVEKLHDMAAFAQNMRECRKIHFAKYFSSSSDIDMSAWTTDDAEALEPCKHCDNCTRAPESVEHRDCTLQAWQILKIVAAVGQGGGKLTQSMIGDLARGAGGGAFSSSKKKEKGKGSITKEKIDIDLDAICGGKVEMSKDDIETLLVELTISGYLKESFHQTSYAMNVYLIIGSQAPRLSRVTRKDVADLPSPRIDCSFRVPVKKPRAKSSKNAKASSSKSLKKTDEKWPPKKRKRAAVSDDSDEASSEDEEHDNISDPDGNDELYQPKRKPKAVNSDADDDGEEVDNDWTYDMRPSKKLKSSQSVGSRRRKLTIPMGEVLVISD